MKKIIITILVFLKIGVASSAYYPLDNNYLNYNYIEFVCLENNSCNKIFIFNQPYNYNQISKILPESSYLSLYHKLASQKPVLDEMFLNFSPGLKFDSELIDTSYSSVNSYFDIETLFKFGDSHLKFKTELDKSLIMDENFHGDKKEFLTGYVREAYFLLKNKSMEYFLGRVSRNYGIPNEFSLIYSNNPFSFDHYGFSAIGKKIKYSFYVSRLNDLEDSIDSQGIVFAEGDTVSTKRYFSFQQFDFKINKKIQASIAQSIIYGGPNTTFEGPLINPMNFYYADQRNSDLELNTLWNFLFFYKINKTCAFYLNLLVDDFVINNNEDYERDIYEDRLGYLIKFSKANFIFPSSLSTLSYTKIHNYTYTTFRNFENYTYQLSGIGFPFNSYESIKFSQTLFNSYPNIYKIGINFNRFGDTTLFDIFSIGKKSFPVGPVTYNINVIVRSQYKINNFVEINLESDWLYCLNNPNNSSISLKKGYSELGGKIKILYYLY